MKKTLVGILSIVIIILLAGCSNQEDTGSSNNTSITSDNYILSIKSSELGHPNKGYAFSTSSQIENKEYNNKKYTLTYSTDYSYIIEKDVKVDYPNIDNYKKVTINNKTFSYTMDNKLINLIYQPKEMNCYINIKVSLDNVFDSTGELSDEKIEISIDDLQNKNVSGTINFDIKKK